MLIMARKYFVWKLVAEKDTFRRQCLSNCFILFSFADLLLILMADVNIASRRMLCHMYHSFICKYHNHAVVETVASVSLCLSDCAICFSLTRAPFACLGVALCMLIQKNHSSHLNFLFVDHLLTCSVTDGVGTVWLALPSRQNVVLFRKTNEHGSVNCRYEILFHCYLNNKQKSTTVWLFSQLHVFIFSYIIWYLLEPVSHKIINPRQSLRGHICSDCSEHRVLPVIMWKLMTVLGNMQLFYNELLRILNLYISVLQCGDVCWWTYCNEFIRTLKSCRDVWIVYFSLN